LHRSPARLSLALAALLSFPLAHAAAGPASAVARALPAPQVVSIPVHEATGPALAMVAHVFRPPGDGPFPVVLFSHGRLPGKAARAALDEGSSRAQLRFWLAHGVAVVAPIRPGYGPSPGDDPEQSFVRHDKVGRCVGQPDYRRTADAASRTVIATLAWLGGLTTVAAAAQHPAGVVGYINFAGGSGGDPSVSPGTSCDPGQIGALYAGYARTTTVPNLWVYATNDQYWGPDEPVAWHEAFAKAGSSRTTFVHAPAVEDGDGHGLSRHDPQLWAPYVERFLATLPFLPAAPASR
jgi:dienelactone hydrolase